MSGDDPKLTAIKLIEEQANAKVRRVWHNERWYFSVIDVLEFLTETGRPRAYWTDLKAKLAAEGASQTYDQIVQLKMTAADGKQRLTDAADTQTIFRIIQSVPSPKAEPFKRWLARVATEHLEEMGDPSLAADRMRREYARLGYPDAWINERLKNVVARDAVTAEWRERGAREGRDFAVLTE